MRTKFVLIIAVLLGLIAGAVWWSKRSVPKASTVGIITWIGYGPLFVGEDQGFFKKRGLNLEIRVMDGPGEREAALLSGQLDFLPNTPDAFSILFANQPKLGGKIFLALDESIGADGLVATKDIADIAGLKGKTVGFQEGITSHFLLLALLEKAGLKQVDIRTQNLEAGAAGAAFQSGKLDAAVTWEPWLTKAQERPDSHVLATSKDTPGLLVDMVFASEAVLREHPERVKAFVDAWFDSVAFMKEHPDKAREIISRGLKTPANEVADMLKTTKFFDRPESVAYLRDKAPEILGHAARLYQKNGVISAVPPSAEHIDTRVLEQ